MEMKTKKKVLEEQRVIQWNVFLYISAEIMENFLIIKIQDNFLLLIAVIKGLIKKLVLHESIISLRILF